MLEKDTLTYAQPSDAIRRAMIRYTYPIYQIFSEYTPFLINKQILKPAFTAKELYNALHNLGIKCAKSTIYARIKEPYNPIIAPLNSHPMLENSTQFIREDIKDTLYFLKPIHEVISTIRQVAYYREYENGYSKIIPPIELYEELMEDEDLFAIKKIYEKINYKQNRNSLKWVDYYSHFSDFSDNKRTRINNSTVTKPSMFKVAFFDAMIKEGAYKYEDITKITGIHPKNITPVLKYTKLSKKSRRILLKADSPYDAMNQAGKDASYAIPLGNNKYAIQMKPTFTLKKEPDLLPVQQPRITTPQQNRFNINNTIKTHPIPAFQERFLIHALKRATCLIQNDEGIKNISTLQDMLTYIKSLPL